MNNYRQGDVSLHATQKPENLRRIEMKSREYTLAYGEQTGHRHRLLEREIGQFEVYQDEKGRNVLNIKKPTDLVHEEHKTITLQPGWYVQEYEREFDPFLQDIRKVVD